jgi:hypothetical protein
MRSYLAESGQLGTLHKIAARMEKIQEEEEESEEEKPPIEYSEHR